MLTLRCGLVNKRKLPSGGIGWYNAAIRSENRLK